MKRDKAMKVVRLLATARNNAVICGKNPDAAAATVIDGLDTILALAAKGDSRGKC